MKIAFLTAGGIAPCLSSSIAGLINNYTKYHPDSEMICYLHGYRGLLIGNSISVSSKIKQNISTLFDYGGSPIGNSRVKLTNIKDCVQKGFIKKGEDPLKVAANQLMKDKIYLQEGVFDVLKRGYRNAKDAIKNITNKIKNLISRFFKTVVFKFTEITKRLLKRDFNTGLEQLGLELQATVSF